MLVIDAFEVRGDSQFENRMMDHIIDKRYDAMLATIVISNDKPEVLSSALGQSIMDRIAQTGGMIEMDGESFRRAG
jgi:DNA replication protein DnaC